MARILVAFLRFCPFLVNSYFSVTYPDLLGMNVWYVRTMMQISNYFTINEEKAENITKVIYRLQEYVKYKGITLNQIAVVIGVSNSYFSKMANSGGSLGEDIIRKYYYFTMI